MNLTLPVGALGGLSGAQGAGEDASHRLCSWPDRLESYDGPHFWWWGPHKN